MLVKKGTCQQRKKKDKKTKQKKTAIKKVATSYNNVLFAIGLDKLCQHDFENNRCTGSRIQEDFENLGLLTYKEIID